MLKKLINKFLKSPAQKAIDRENRTRRTGDWR